MKQLFFILLLPFLANAQETNKSEIINPDGKWYFGAEMGLNTIADGEHDQSLQGGLMAEYYIGKNWSVLTKIKYHKTGLSKGSTSFQKFEGKVLYMPINLKRDYTIYRNLRASIRFGVNLNLEVERKFQNAIDFKTDLPRLYLDGNFAIGLSYFVSKKTAAYFDAELKGLGREREKTAGWFGPNATGNSFLNFGIKYNFKK
jgi:predicted porin